MALKRLGIRLPIIQAPMAGVDTPKLAAEVSNAGGLGSLGIGAMSVEQGRKAIRQTRELTNNPFNVNIFCNERPVHNEEVEKKWISSLSQEFSKFDADPPSSLKEIYTTGLNSEDMLNMLLEEKPGVVSFHFGVPDKSWISKLKQSGIVTMACATNIEEAKKIEESGIDILVAQGYEAGGHRGIFNPDSDEMISTQVLLRTLASKIKLPLVAAGGIMDGVGISSALKLGASAVQMGTAFILCPESAASKAHREKLKGEYAWHTGITSAISGRPARGIINRMHQINKDIQVPDYPLTYDIGKALHKAASIKDNHDYAAHWAGQGAPLSREMSAKALIEQLELEMKSN